MKILNLHFKNINSLEGETRIDFTQAPFADTGVFAITGPNGSGKSSILDAITLGLYGETFRFDRPAAHVMTKQTADCFSVVEFALGDERYQAGWKVERANGVATGELQPAVMQLMRLNSGEIVANTPQQVCARITDITGMNFRTFTRSVLLAQGDFAAFLNALDAERMDILEKIISADIYADYKQQVIANAEQVKQAINQTEQQLEALTLLSPTQQEAHEHDLIDYKEQLAEARSEQNQLKQQQDAVKNVSVLQSQIMMQKKTVQRIKNDVEQVEQKLATVQDNKHVLVFKADAEQIHAQQQSIQQTKASLSTLQNDLVQLKSKFDNTHIVDITGKTLAEQQQLISSLKTQSGQLTANTQSEVSLQRSLQTQINDKQAELEVLADWLNAHEADESLVKHFPELDKLTSVQTNLADLNAQYKKLVKQAQSSSSALEKNTVALEKEQNKLREEQQALATNEQELTELMAQYTLEQLDELREEQQQRVKAFQELQDVAAAHQRLVKSASSGFFSLFGGKKSDEEPDLIDLELVHDELKQEVLREENIKTVLEQAVFREGLIKKMADVRQHLVDGRPCYLCGALDHPYSRQAPVTSNSQQALYDQKAKIKNLLAKTYEAAQRLEAAKRKAETKSTNWARRQRLSSHWLSLCTRLNAFSPDLTISNLPLMAEMLKSETEELKNLTSLAMHYRQTQHNIAKLKVAIDKTTANIERLQASIDVFTTDSEQHNQQQRELEAQLQQVQQQEQQLTEAVVNQLAALGEALPSGKKAKKGDDLFERLTARKQTYQDQTERYKTAQHDIALLTEKQANCTAEIKQYKQQLDELAARLQQEENTVLQLTIIEKQQQIANQEQLLAEQNAKLAELQQTLQANIQTVQLNSLNELEERLVLLQTESKLEQQLMQFKTEISNKTAAMEKTNKELEAAVQLAETALNPEELTVRLKQTNEQIELANLEIQRLERLLNEQAKQLQQQQKLQKQLQQQQAEAKPYLDELASLTAEHGIAFRRKVQQQLANRLLAQTNEILEKISGRYYLRQTPSENGLALIVEDTLQGNAQRLPKTLSGGESFVVSLALALGLSELASNGRSVDSLFIDEGFGNLDAETLYTIISTLENLHTQGKTVGVISHVEAVQKRFKAQLQVVKKPNGMGLLQTAS